MNGLASCTFCRAPLAGDDILRLTLHALASEAPELTAEVFESAKVQAQEAVWVERAKQHERDRERDASYATHEAAHAVVAVILDVEVEQVDIDTARVCRTIGPSPSPSLGAVLDLAGIAADQLECGIHELLSDRHLTFAFGAARAKRKGGCDHCLAAKDLLGSMPTATDEALKERLQKIHKETIRFVARFREPIRAVADALRARGHLSGDEVRHVLKGYSL